MASNFWLHFAGDSIIHDPIKRRAPNILNRSVNLREKNDHLKAE